MSKDGGENPPSEPTSAEIQAYQKLFMSSYWAERGGAPAGAAGRALTPFLPKRGSSSRATVSVAALPSAAFATLAANSPASNTLADYPEPGQSTVFAVALVAGTPSGTAVYDVTATTSYASSDLRKTYVEEYYVQDLGLNAENPAYNTGYSPDGAWTYDDPIVKKDASGAWSYDPAIAYAEPNKFLLRDQKARVRQILTFQDGTTRSETIVSDSNGGGTLFDVKPFDVEGSLDLSQAFVPDKDASDDVLFSSVIVYSVTPATKPDFWFWTGSVEQSILGIRYYTEEKDEARGTYTARSASFEKVVSAIVTTGGSMTKTLKGISSGTEFDALAENVLRQQVISTLDLSGSYPTALPNTGQISTRMRSRVVNITGSKDFYIEQLNSDAAKLSLLDTSLYTPAGAAEELLAQDPSLFAYMREQQANPAEGSLPFAISTTSVAGTGTMATVYTSIAEQTYTEPEPTAPDSNVLPSVNSIATFDGQQAMGTVIDSGAVALSGAMGSKGTVEAWIYIEAFTNTPGIVHKGVAADFSDECFSLQGWGSNGQMAIVLDKPGAGNEYDAVFSNSNLKKKTWYHLVATWDASLGAGSFIRLYVNGDYKKKGGSDTPTVALYRENASALLVGSQLPSIYSSAYGYFGFDGKITGVNLFDRALTEAEVTARYDADKAAAAGW
ncbi:MAG: LamG domain-containing protein [Spirochaetaceae bacterium]|nr:LamG domain-containing protein [Spirochaetaceae bacterium]